MLRVAQLCHELSGKPDDMNSPDIEACQPFWPLARASHRAPPASRIDQGRRVRSSDERAAIKEKWSTPYALTRGLFGLFINGLSRAPI